MSIIEVDNLTKTYAGVKVVDAISFNVEQGEIFGIVGPNGAGKTTTVETIEGLQQPDGGTIRVLGLDPIRDRYEVTQKLGAQLQESRLQDKIRVGEALDLYASFYESPADWRELLTKLGLAGKEKAKYSSLSGGQKQRLAVALALIGSPEVAILDELTTGLDPQARRSVWETIETMRDNGVTVVLVTHFMEEAERLCNRIMVVDKGRVAVLGTPDALVKRIGSGQLIRFRPSAEVADAELTALPGVESVARKGEMIEIAGTDDAVHSVTSLLAQCQIIAHELRIEQNSLEDAYLALIKEDS